MTKVKGSKKGNGKKGNGKHGVWTEYEEEVFMLPTLEELGVTKEEYRKRCIRLIDAIFGERTRNDKSK